MPHPTALRTTRQSELSRLQQEVTLLRSLMISWMGQDDEGEYRPALVQRILKSVTEKPTQRFTNPRAFLKDLEQA